MRESSLLAKLGFLFCDNKPTIMLASDFVLHERSKRIEVDVHYIQEKVRLGVIIPSFVPSSILPADVFTKSDDPSLLQSFVINKVGLSFEGECWKLF